MNIIIWDYESVWFDSWPESKLRSLMTYSSRSSDLMLHIEDKLMYGYHSLRSSDPYFIALWLYLIPSTLWCLSVIFTDNDTVWPKLWPQSKYKSAWPIFHGLVILLNILDYLMDKHHSCYNGSMWHIRLISYVYVGKWPIFHGPAILLNIEDFFTPEKLYLGW